MDMLVREAAGGGCAANHDHFRGAFAVALGRIAIAAH
jgi:hypothetical protein